MNNNISILICDDNIAVHESLTAYLKAENMNVVSVYDGPSSLDEITKNKYDLIILDINLPNLLGTEICRIVRQKSNIPIIMLSARDEEVDKIIGLELGADDYVTKPFSPREVVTRIRTILRRSYPLKESNTTKIEELSINMDGYEVFVENQKIDLTPKEFEVLCYLVQNRGKVLSREQILYAVWDYDYGGDTRAVDTQIKRIRQKLPEKNVHFRVKTIYGVGYIFEVFENA